MNDRSISTSNKLSYCIVFNKNQLLFKKSEGRTQFPLINEAEKLGIDVSNIIYIGTLDDIDYYATNVSTINPVENFFLKHISEAYGELEENIFFLTLRALHFLNWLNRNKYCGCCGTKVKLEPKETHIKCLNCGHVIYPKITPAIIVAILKDDKILLARSPHFTPNMYSLISGHIDPGEFIETCVRREVKEEVGIEIKNIKYFGSHPWPFPDKLMLGFIAEYSSGEIKIDNDEIEAADWFSLDNLPNIPEYKLSFARKIIEWVLKNR
ncbi:NAD(+) diphosphatase [Sporosalibacterium faouarense]|uniref:NAD(+) diphosphatase n=1 Tax=Sporosalibacterium faouarense TaxID=516123 RepID=UPI00192C3CC0|nr:NAD(+) diphosphatase [Sporosalibacterium faouarense]